MNISFVETEPWEEELFRNAFPNDTLFFSPSPLSLPTVPIETEILSTFIYSSVTKEVIHALPKLRCIATRSTGIDHIDIETCKARNIQVKNVPAYGVNTIAEHTFALILALSRKLYPSIERTKKGNFSLENLRGFELSGKTIGIIGLGAVSSRVIQLAHAFGMKIVINTRHPDIQQTGRFQAQYVNLPTLLATSDIVSIHVPATAETRHMINKNNINLMKHGSFLINTARGSIVETEAIILALEQGILAGAGLDVLEEERALKEERELVTKEYLSTGDIKIQLFNHILLQHEQVIITPHNAFNSEEALREIVDTTIRNIRE